MSGFDLPQDPAVLELPSTDLPISAGLLLSLHAVMLARMRPVEQHLKDAQAVFSWAHPAEALLALSDSEQVSSQQITVGAGCSIVSLTGRDASLPT